jgi:hypothetical protein
MEAAARPLPREERTPPVININLVFLIWIPFYGVLGVYSIKKVVTLKNFCFYNVRAKRNQG